MNNIHQEYENLETTAPKCPHFNEDQRKELFKSALDPFSLSKNRYPDILALESTRVHLKKIDGIEGSDYINANFIINEQYISCQAPIFSTIADFWRMIWENRSPIILMLTKFFENGRTKAHQYWPANNNVPITFGDIKVTKIEEEQDFHGSLVIRTILLSRGDEIRKVYHFHYTAWPDFGVPCETDGVRELVNLINDYRFRDQQYHGENDSDSDNSDNSSSDLSDDNSNPSSLSTSSDDSFSADGPIVVHCSAGVGRSGTFIAIHYACSLIDNFIEPSILEIAAQMRCDRVGMIQNEKQFEFIHLAVQDYRNCHSEIAISTNFSTDDAFLHNYFQSASDPCSPTSISPSNSLSSTDSATSSSSSSSSNFSNLYESSPSSSDWRRISSVGVNSLSFAHHHNQNPFALNVLS